MGNSNATEGNVDGRSAGIKSTPAWVFFTTWRCLRKRRTMTSRRDLIRAGALAVMAGAVPSSVAFANPVREEDKLAAGSFCKQSATKLLRQVPSIGPIRAALLIALIQTPHRFRTKRQLWTYSGRAINTRDSAQHRYVGGQLQRSKKPQQVRGLNQNHNHDMKAIFKSAATMASSREGAFHDFYQGLLTKGMKPAMARLTLARKIATITLIVWKKGAHFDAKQLKLQ